MKKEIMKSKTDLMISDLENTKKVCQMLMETPHYKKMGAEGIFAIVEKAKSVGISPMDALNGGMYFVQGKVEMTSAMMNQLIRVCGHSITKDKRSDETICILHGRRADNGDTWVESFSIDDAKKAGIYRNQWEKYPKDMLFARALSRLARQLFPDVIKGCYVQGEIAEAVVEETTQCEVVDIETKIVSEEEIKYLDEIIADDDEYRVCVLNYLERLRGSRDLSAMQRDEYEKILPVAEKRQRERQQVQQQLTAQGE